MDGGTVFHFVTDGIGLALAQANEWPAAVTYVFAGGVATIRRYLNARLIDDMHIVVSPVLLGSREPLLAGTDRTVLGSEVTEHVASEKATHVVLSKRAGPGR